MLIVLKLSPRINRGGHERPEAGPPASSRIKRNDSSSFDRRNSYQVDAPRIDRGRGDYDTERRRAAPTYDQHCREEQRRYQSRYDDRRSSYGSVPQSRKREDYDFDDEMSTAYNPYNQTPNPYDPFAPKINSYDQHIREQERRGSRGRAAYRTRIDNAPLPFTPIQIAPHRDTHTEQRHRRHASPTNTSGPSYLDKYYTTSQAVTEWEDSLEPGSGESDIDGMDDSPSLPFKGIPTDERPFCEARFLPLCRAIKACLVRSYYATADEVEERLLRDDADVFHKIDLDSFRQYVFEAKRSGAPVNFTQNVDDQITRLYFCLTRKMVSRSKLGE